MCLYLLCYVCIAIFTLDAGLLARIQYSESPVTGHLDTGLSWVPCVYKQMLRWFPRFQLVTTCFSCSPPDLKFIINQLHILYTCKITTATGRKPYCSLLLLLLLLLFRRNMLLFIFRFNTEKNEGNIEERLICPQ